MRKNLKLGGSMLINKKSIFSLLTLSLVLFLFLPSYISIADTHLAATCSQADISAAINAASDGDTVSIPPGTCTWSSAVSFSKALKIQGAGEGVTNIVDGRFSVSVPDGKSYRITGMTVSGASFISDTGASKSFRIDHITLNNSTGYSAGRAFWFQPSSNGTYQEGVLDHLTVNNCVPGGVCIHFRGPQNEGGNSSWMRPLGLGGSDAIYIEDSTFTYPSSGTRDLVDAEAGARYVFRHNNVTNGWLGMHDAIIGGFRAVRKWEFYNNTFTTTPAGTACFVASIRGGTGVMFNNTIINDPGCSAYIQLENKRQYQTSSNPWDVLCSNTSGKAILNTSTTNPAHCTSGTGCVDLDGTAISPNGWPCRDQIGADGNAPQTGGGVPALFWGNMLNGSYVSRPNGDSYGYITNGRDFCVNNNATMPSSCNGVATTYVPYTYPHPLTTANLPLPSTGGRVPNFPAISPFQ